MSWTAEALCAQTDPDAWFTDQFGVAKNEQAKRARSICRQCPVREQCLAEGLTETVLNLEGHHGLPEGIWGGLDQRERYKLVGRSGRRDGRRVLPPRL